MEEIKQLMKKLEGERDDILAKSKHLHEKRAELAAKIQPLEDGMRAIDKEIKAIERPRLNQVGLQIARLARALPSTKTLKNDG